MASKIIHMVVIESETSAKQSEEPPTKSKWGKFKQELLFWTTFLSNLIIIGSFVYKIFKN